MFGSIQSMMQRDYAGEGDLLRDCAEVYVLNRIRSEERDASAQYLKRMPPMQEITYQPGAAAPNLKGPILLVLPVLFIVAWVSAHDIESRLMLLGFIAAFIALAFLGVRYHQSRFDYPLTLDATGIAWQPFAERYGANKVPWQEIERIEMFRGASNGVGRGPRWLCLYLRDGAFQQKLKRPLGEQIVGGHVNVLLSFDVKPEEVVEQVRRFHREFG